MTPAFRLSRAIATASRFYQRWIAAAPGREERVAQLAQLSLACPDFGALLAQELSAGIPLARAMRRLRNLLLATLIRRELEGRSDLNEVVSAMTGLADFAIRTHLADLMAELVTAHGMPMGAESGRPQEMMVLAMGKQGGGELNVSSDIDLIFVYPEDGETAAGPGQRELSNHEFFVRLGRRLIGALSEVIEDGFTFRVDMALRPNGNSGPLAASLNMVEEYLIVQGREWERYAWVKARAVTGQRGRHRGAGRDRAALRVPALPRLRRDRRDPQHARPDPRRSQTPGTPASGPQQQRQAGARRDPRDRIPGPGLPADPRRARPGPARALDPPDAAPGGRARADDASRPSTACWRPTPSCATSNTACNTWKTRKPTPCRRSRPTAWSSPSMMGLPDVATLLARLEEQRAFVAAQFDDMFADKSAPGGEERAELEAIAADPEAIAAIEAHLGALGYDDPAGGARRLAATWGAPRLQGLPDASRVRLLALVNQALPQVAKVVVEAGVGSHGATLGRLLDFLEAIARRSAYLSLLSEYPHTLERVIRMMHASGWAATFLTLHPILLDELLDDRGSGIDAPDVLAASLDAQLAEAVGDTERQLDILRENHHAQLFRLLSLDLAGELSVERLADHLSALADVIVAATVRWAWKTVTTRHVEVPRFAVIAYGKLGGKELGYVSDLDVIFLYDDEDDMAPSNYAKLGQRFITWMTAHTPAGILFDIDTALRPDGASGMLVSSLPAFERYQHNAAWVWEHQALTRARFCAGDAAIGARFEEIREAVLRRDRSAQEERTESGSGQDAPAHARRLSEPQRAVRPEAGRGRHDRHRIHRPVPGAAPRRPAPATHGERRQHRPPAPQRRAGPDRSGVRRRRRRRLPGDAQTPAPAAPARGRSPGRGGAGGRARGGRDPALAGHFRPRRM